MHFINTSVTSTFTRVCPVQLDRHRNTQRNYAKALTSLTHEHSQSHIISQMDTQLAAEISEVCIHLRSAVSWSFTAEAADNMLLAAAEEPGEGEQLQDRIQEACWSCDRSTCPWPRPSGVGKELRQVDSCTEHSYHCCEENTNVTMSTNSKYVNWASTCDNDIFLFSCSKQNVK